MGWFSLKPRKQTEYEKVIREHQGLLQRLVSSYERDVSKQQDLMQEVLLAIWQSYGSFEGKSSLKTYLAKIALNRCVTHVAKEATKREEPFTEEHEKSTKDLAEAFSKQQQIERLLIKIRNMKPLARQVMVLMLEGFSQKEIAESCNTTEGNVAVIVNRSRKQLLE